MNFLPQSLPSRQVGGRLEVLRLSIHLLVDWLLIHNSISTGMPPPSPFSMDIILHTCVTAGLPWLVVGVFRFVSVFSLALWTTIAVKESMKQRKVKVQ